jgi:hypothetical protein
MKTRNAIFEAELTVSTLISIYEAKPQATSDQTKRQSDKVTALP